MATIKKTKNRVHFVTTMAQVACKRAFVVCGQPRRLLVMPHRSSTAASQGPTACGRSAARDLQGARRPCLEQCASTASRLDDELRHAPNCAAHLTGNNDMMNATR